MGVVVAMTPRNPALTSAQSAARHEGSAEILFFTGVRYYRMPDDAPAPVAAGPKRRKAAKAKPARLQA